MPRIPSSWGPSSECPGRNRAELCNTLGSRDSFPRLTHAILAYCATFSQEGRSRRSRRWAIMPKILPLPPVKSKRVYLQKCGPIYTGDIYKWEKNAKYICIEKKVTIFLTYGAAWFSPSLSLSLWAATC